MKRNAENPDEEDMQHWKNPAELADRLLWDAVDRAAGWVHISPEGKGHEIRYRKGEGLEELVKLGHGGFSGQHRGRPIRPTAMLRVLVSGRVAVVDACLDFAAALIFETIGSACLFALAAAREYGFELLVGRRRRRLKAIGHTCVAFALAQTRSQFAAVVRSVDRRVRVACRIVA